MGQTKLDAGDAVGEQVAQAGSQKDRNRFVDVELAAQAKDAVADKRPGNRHREGVGAQRGQPAVCQQQRLEQQHDDADYAHRAGAKQDGAQPCPGGVGAGAGDAGDLEGGEHKGIGAGHRQDQQRLAVLGHRPFNGDQARGQKGQAQRAPGHRVTDGQIALHDVHCAGAGRHGKQQGRGAAEGEQSFFVFLHGKLPSFPRLFKKAHKM